jgi:hypothetical protein
MRCHFDDGAALRMIRHHFVRDEVITARNRRAPFGAALAPSQLQGATTSSVGK